ncbi:hypothetical protein ACMA1I_20250 [Pontibacter sp. 13R65]|uniref:hypothetical protein n=1 Tax=Pontibacter sp. 13R65 TaxID=3127458 RepID=UPI00301C3103
MILKIRKNYPIAAKWLSVTSILPAARSFSERDYLLWACFTILGVLLWLLSDVYFGLRLKEKEGKLAIGYGLGKLFRAQEEFFFHEVKGLLILQQSDRNYGIGLSLSSGRFILLEKISTLQKAKARQIELTEKFDRALIRQKNKVT